MSVIEVFRAEKKPFIVVAGRIVPGNVYVVPHTFELDDVPHMRFRRAVVVYAVTLYADAGNSQSVHNGFEAHGIASADSFAVYERAVSRAYISRRGSFNVIAVLYLIAEAVHGIVANVLVNVFDLFLDPARSFRRRNNRAELAFVLRNCRFDFFGSIEASVVQRGYPAAVEKGNVLAAHLTGVNGSAVRVDIEQIGMVHYVRVASRAVSFGNPHIAVFDIAFHVAGGNHVVVYEIAFSSATAFTLERISIPVPAAAVVTARADTAITAPIRFVIDFIKTSDKILISILRKAQNTRGPLV